MTVYIVCKFRKEDSRGYTYEYSGPETFAPGDEVMVPDKSGDGWNRVHVVLVTDEVPSYTCKPVLGRYVPEPEADDASECKAVDSDFTGGIDDTILF